MAAEPSTSQDNNEIERAEEAEEWSRRREIQEKLRKVNEVLKVCPSSFKNLRIKIKKNETVKSICIALSQVHKEKEKIVQADYSRLFLDGEKVKIGTKWNPEASLILKRGEWIDPMVQNCFL